MREQGCTSLYYVLYDNNKWSISSEANGSVAGSGGFTISTKILNDKLVVWGDVGNAIYNVDTDAKEEVSFSRIRLITSEDKRENIAIQNNREYLQVTRLKEVTGWTVYDNSGNKLLNASEYKKKFGADLIEPF